MHIGSKIVHYEKVSSTNSLALELIRQGRASDGMVISAGYQSEGRGQRENRWFSDPLTNLTMSIILRPSFLHPSEQFLVSKAVSVAIAETLGESGHSFTIKWPNDIYSGGDKIAGILIESSITGDRIDWCVAGIGININQEQFPLAIPNPISLKLLTGITYNLTEVGDRLLRRLDLWYERLRSGDREMIDSSYLELLYRRGESHIWISGDKSFRGKIEGVNPSGQLLIETEEGVCKTFSFKEVEFTH